ncbi:MAG: class I SAM-dependent methyltransferase [bacterium]|nr:class I SAM-dependent methyltransferase [bacterium]
MKRFDYQKKVWGTSVPTISPFSLAGLRIYYFLKNIRGVYGKLLEVGCGAGGNLQAFKLHRPYLELYGVDIGTKAILEGTRLFPSIHLKVAEAEKLPYDDATFNIVCFFDVLEHVSYPLACIKEAQRVLKPSGILHAYIPCEGEIFSLHGMLNRFGINLKEKTAGHIQKLTRKGIEEMCKEVGLDIIDVTWSCHLLNQIGDLSYYLYLTITGTSLEYSLEGSLQKNSVGSRLLSWIKAAVSFTWYWESRILWWLPGAGLHLTCRKRVIL